MSPELEARMREIDTALDLEPGHGIAQVWLESLMENIESGDHSLILDGWSFEDPAEAAATVAKLFPQT